MRHTFTILLLLWPALAWGQIPGGFTVGGSKPSKEQVQQAQKVIADATADDGVLRLEVGEFEVVQIKEENGKLAIVGPVAWFAVNEAVVKRLDVPANHPFPIYLKRRGEPKAKLHVLPPQKHPYWLMIGDQVGNSPFLMVQNGADAAKPPVEAHRISVQVGPDKPKPDPDIDPKPPGPVPIIDKGLRVLIVWETKDLSNYPAAQVAAVNSTEVRQYLSAKCVKVNGHPEWRVYDPDTDVTRESKVWQDAMKIKRDKLPWIIVSDGEKGTSEPLPADKDALMNLLKLYGGQ
jgi:hypothetical protein